MNVDKFNDSASPVASSPEENEDEHNPFPIVAVGASAGGLEAFSQLLAHLPPETGMAFILVQHLDPNHESRLPDLLANTTSMPVVEATNGIAVCSNHVYVIPPNANLIIEHGILRVTPRSEVPGLHLPVDWLFRSLSKDQQARAIGVVLSGTGSDGTLGLCEIKAVGGITFAQDEQSAKHWGMPRCAIDSGCVDFVLPPETIARRLAEIGQHPYLAPVFSVADPMEDEVSFNRILAVVRAATGVDFSQYRNTTIRRRTMRRMALRTQQSLADYARLLETEKGEVEALYRDLLINVTSFFRDPDMFEALKSDVLPELMKNKAPNVPLRLWVAGCATGQEAYSLAITFWEFFDDKPTRPAIQIFATDLSDTPSLERARAGLYPESIESEMSPERLRRFFKKEDNLYRVDKTIRDLCVFARQNITADPPFSHVDLITCRNVLIYMAPPLQKRVLPIFHYALNTPGFLVLGSSETVGEFTNLFEQVNRGHKIYAKKAVAARLPLHFSVDDNKVPLPISYRASSPGTMPLDFQKEADRLLLRHYAPPGVLVNGNFDILQFRGHTSAYLEQPPGEPTMSVLKMAREGLFLELRNALNEAKTRNEAVRRERVVVRDSYGMREVNLQVLPVPPSAGNGTDCLLVLFEEAGTLASNNAVEPSLRPQPVLNGDAETTSGFRHWWRKMLAPLPVGIAETQMGGNKRERETMLETNRELVGLRQELAATKEYLQSLIEQQDTANEELRAANEEISSSNEELQSTNEELETAKEELQSSNEELTTINEQLQYRNLELNQTTNDLTNLLTSTTIPVIMVGNDLRIRRMTSAARKFMNLLPADIGRPIGDLRANIDVPDLEALIGQVIEAVGMQEREIQDLTGHWSVLRVYPYRTTDNKIDGAVITLLDIDEVKRAQQAVRENEEQFRRALEEAPIPIIMQAEDGEILQISRSWTELTGYTLEDIPTLSGWLTRAYGFGADNVRSHVQKLFESTIGTTEAEFDVITRNGEKRIWRFSASIPGKLHDGRRFIVAMAIDVTERKAAAALLAEEDRHKNEFLAILGHELHNPLAPIAAVAKILRMAGNDTAQVAKIGDILERQVTQLSRIVGDLLDIARIGKGQIELCKERVAIAKIVDIAVETCHSFIQACHQKLTVTLPSESLYVDGDPARLAQVLINLLNNSAKFGRTDGQIRLTVARLTGRDAPRDQLEIRVSDNGIGVSAELLPRIFDMFAQGEISLRNNRRGLGVGLALVKQLVQMHEGTVEANSAGADRGTEFIITLPLATATIEPSEPAPSNQHDQPVRQKSHCRILVVDDHRDSAECLGTFLTLLGHEVWVAYDGSSALEIADSVMPNIALLDIDLPELNGYEVARQLRKKIGSNKIVLIAQTGYGHKEDLLRLHEAGFDHHFLKPVDLEALKKLLAVCK